MSTVVIRSRKKSSGPLFNLSEDAQRRARKHLEAMGTDIERLPRLIWPDDAVSAYQDHRYDPWKFVTEADVKKKRQDDAKEVLRFKRDEYRVVTQRPLYVWVFWCPGWVFEGWWTYLIGRGVEHGGKYQTDSDLILRAMKMFPVVEPTLFDVEDGWKEREKWMIAFAKRYQRGIRGGKPQGKTPIWAEVQGDQIIRLLDRADWPENI